MKKRIITIFLVFVLCLVISGCNSKKANNTTKEESYIAVEVETIVKKDLFIENILSGKVFADKDIYVIPKMVGKVEEVRVNIGDRVNKDDILYIIDKEDIENQVNQAKTAYETAKANYDMSVEQIKNAQTAFERTKKLYEEGAISQAQYEQVELAASEKPLEAAEKGLKQAELAYNQAKDALANVEVKAPIDGTITSINIEPGEYATNTQPSMTIMEMDYVVIKLGVTENIVNKINRGDTIALDIDSANYHGNAEINIISESVNPMTGLYPVEIFIKNNGLIKPGMFAKVNIKTDIIKDTIAVKSEAVLEKEGKYIVFLQEEDKSIEREVATGLDTGVYIEIINGLNVGDKIITKGQNYINDGSKIKVVRGE